MCTLKSENKICWSFYVFFDLVVISSVLTMLNVYCSIVDFIERIYFQKCLVKQKKKTKKKTKKNKKKEIQREYIFRNAWLNKKTKKQKNKKKKKY